MNRHIHDLMIVWSQLEHSAANAFTHGKRLRFRYRCPATCPKFVHDTKIVAASTSQNVSLAAHAWGTHSLPSYKIPQSPIRRDQTAIFFLLFLLCDKANFDRSVCSQLLKQLGFRLKICKKVPCCCA